MKGTESKRDMERHILLMCYVFIALVLAIFGRGVLMFDLTQTLGYGVLAYLLLIVLNYRAVLAKQPNESQ